MTQDTIKPVKKCPFPVATGLVNDGCLCNECYYNSGIDCYCALEVRKPYTKTQDFQNWLNDRLMKAEENLNDGKQDNQTTRGK